MALICRALVAVLMAPLPDEPISLPLEVRLTDVPEIKPEPLIVVCAVRLAEVLAVIAEPIVIAPACEARLTCPLVAVIPLLAVTAMFPLEALSVTAPAERAWLPLVVIVPAANKLNVLATDTLPAPIVSPLLLLI